MNHRTEKRMARQKSIRKRRNILRNNTKASKKVVVEKDFFPHSAGAFK